jgi:hypothetical protein
MILVQLTNGFGNNIFQYTAAKLLADFHSQEVFAVLPSSDYYAFSDLKNLGIQFYEGPKNLSSFVRGNDQNYRDLFNVEFSHHNFILNGYFENYKYFEKHIEKIKTWYPQVNKRDNSDLVIHFRAGDRLFYKNEFDTKPAVKNYLKAIEKFDFDKLHIVTDMPEWKKVSTLDLQKMSFHKFVEKENSVPLQRSADYFNSFVDGFSKYNPIVQKRTVGEDFNFIRSFDNILFQHGTLSWWASVLSSATTVGVYGPWRPWKGSSNKNLSNVPIKGWFKWK